MQSELTGPDLKAGIAASDLRDGATLVGHADGYWIVIAWFFGLGIGGVVNKVSLGAAGC